MQKLSTFTLAAALLLSLGAIAQPPEPAQPPRIEAVLTWTPEDIVRGFADAISTHLDLEAAARLVEGGQTGDALKPVSAELQKVRVGWTVKDIDVQLKGETASVKLMLQLQHPVFGKIMHQEHLTLHIVPGIDRVGEWKIVPLSAEDFEHSLDDSFDSDMLANIATYLARPQEIRGLTGFSCLSHLRKVALSAEQFVQDYDEKFAFTPATYRQSLLLYTQSEEVFHCPGDESGAVSYSFNANMAHMPLAQIPEPAQTVMIYEGKNGQLEFRHNNRAGIAFADGHCKMVTPEQAKTLRWTP